MSWDKLEFLGIPRNSQNAGNSFREGSENWESNKGRPAVTINTKVSGKVNLIFYKLGLFQIFLVDKVKKKKKKKIRKIVICRIMKTVVLLPQRPVSRNANSASICKFKSNPSILNRVVPQVLFHNLTK